MYSAVFKHQNLAEPGQKDRRPYPVHYPAMADQKAQWMEGPPQELMPGYEQEAHNETAPRHPQIPTQTGAGGIGDFFQCEARRFGGVVFGDQQVHRAVAIG